MASTDCPKCGYAMSEFDVECPRCKRMGESDSKAAAHLPPAPLPPSPLAALSVSPAVYPKVTPAASRPSVQHNATWAHWVGSGLLILFLSVGIRGCVSAVNESGKDKYSAAEYDAFLQQMNQSIAARGLIYQKDFMVEWGGGGDHGILRVTVQPPLPLTPRECKGIADAAAEAYCQRFPNEKSIYVLIKDYQQMTTLYEELYSW